MKETRSLLNSLVVCGVALAMVSTLVAQTADETVAKVIRIKGNVRYKAANNDWLPLKGGDIVKPGTIIQTAAKSQVDFSLGSGSAPIARPPSSNEGLAFQPNIEQNIVRMWENTLMSIDKLTSTQTGADEVTDTQLDLKAGHIFGMVKKMSAGSKYEVKIPNGVAGIRGTVYDISAEGVIKVLSGSCVLAYVGPNGTIVTQLIGGQQEFDARTGTLSPMPGIDRELFDRLVRQVPVGFIMAPTLFTPDRTIIFVSPNVPSSPNPGSSSSSD
jgi:hypothetical protein